MRKPTRQWLLILSMLVAYYHGYGQLIKALKSFGSTSNDALYGAGFNQGEVFFMTGNSGGELYLGPDTVSGGNFLAAITDYVGTVAYVIPVTGVQGLYADKYSNDIFIWGTYSSNLVIGSYQLPYSGPTQVYLARLQQTGDVVWVNTLSDSLNIAAVTTDGSGNVIIAGSEPDGTTNGEQIVVYKCDSLGDSLWIKTADGSALICCQPNSNAANCVSTDYAGNIYIGGFCDFNAEFDSVNFIYPSGLSSVYADYGYTGFIAKYSEDGVAQWAEADGYVVNSIATDSAGNIFTGGYLGGYAIYNTTIVDSGDDKEGWFVSHFDDNGDYQWSVSDSGGSLSSTTSVAIDYLGQCYAAGYQSDSIVYIKTVIDTPCPSTDPTFKAQMMAFSPTGAPLWGRHACGSHSNQNIHIAVDSCDAIVVGTYNTNDLAEGYIMFETDSLKSIGGSDNFFLDLVINNCYPSSITIPVLNNSSLCAGKTYGLPFSIAGNFAIENVFTAQLSDSSGSFAKAVDIGTLIGINGGNIQVVIPLNTPPGHNYHVRVLSSTPGDTATDTINNLSIYPLIMDTVTKGICTGQSYFGYTATGTYIDTFVAGSGCDSIRTLFLTVASTLYDTINTTLCIGQSYDGHFSTGAYIDTFMAIGGCDSIRTLNLMVLPLIVDTITDTILQGNSYDGHDTTGVYVDTFNQLGTCDSIRTLLLTVKDTSTGIKSPSGNLGLQFSLFPNPATGSINLSSSMEIESYSVYDPEGQLVAYREDIKAKTAAIDLQNWAKGIYILQTTIDGQKIVRRFAVM